MDVVPSCDKLSSVSNGLVSEAPFPDEALESELFLCTKRECALKSSHGRYKVSPSRNSDQCTEVIPHDYEHMQAKLASNAVMKQGIYEECSHAFRLQQSHLVKGCAIYEERSAILRRVGCGSLARGFVLRASE